MGEVKSNRDWREECESLRQQLSEANHAHKFMSQQYKDLQKQLAAALAAIKVKNHKLEWLSVKCSKPLHRIRAKEALAIQPDDSALKDVILCEAEPVAWIGQCLEPLVLEDLEKLRRYEPGLATLYETPLYRAAKEQRK